MQRSRIKQSEHGDWCTTMPNWHLGSLVGSLANLLVPGQVIAGPQQTLHRVARLVLPIKAGLDVNHLVFYHFLLNFILIQSNRLGKIYGFPVFTIFTTPCL